MKKHFHVKRETVDGYLFILAAMVIFLVFTIYPMVSAVTTSLKDYRPFGSEWVGAANYKAAVGNALFLKSVKNTLVYTVATVPVSLAISFIVALLIMPFKRKTQSLFKALYYMPAVASGVATSVVWLWIYNSAPSGLFNQIMSILHLPAQNWLSSSRTAMLSLIIMSLLGGHGTHIITYIAALMGIDSSYFEAADIDGASFFQKVWYVVLPLCKPTTLFLLVTGFINSFQVFMNAYMMTGGGPDNNTTMIGLLIFNNAFVYGKYGLACAEAIILACLIACMTAVQFRVMGDNVEY